MEKAPPNVFRLVRLGDSETKHYSTLTTDTGITFMETRPVSFFLALRKYMPLEKLYVRFERFVEVVQMRLS